MGTDCGVCCRPGTGNLSSTITGAAGLRPGPPQERRIPAFGLAPRRGDSGVMAGAWRRIASPCAGHLLDRERAAREAKLGLWADPYYEVLNAETPKDALAYRGRFALVEGKVASVRESGPTIYVNFGRRRTGDITVTILVRS